MDIFKVKCTVEPHFSEHPWDQIFMFVQGGLFAHCGVSWLWVLRKVYRENVWDLPKLPV